MRQPLNHRRLTSQNRRTAVLGWRRWLVGVFIVAITLPLATELASAKPSRSIIRIPTTKEFSRSSRPASQKTQDINTLDDTRLSLRTERPDSVVGVSGLPDAPLMLTEGKVQLSEPPAFEALIQGKFAGKTRQNDIAIYTVSPALQSYVESIIKRVDSPHAAVVAIEPATGRILAIYGKSSTVNDLVFHAGFPAASLFKVITSAAAVDQGILGAESKIAFRGGTYSLNRWNYLPNPRKDHRTMSIAEALGKSCNPVFGRIAYRFLSTRVLQLYANSFGFNLPFGADIPIPPSPAYIPNDRYELSRTAAGFGNVKISPVHAAAIAAAIGNGGLLPRPFLVEKVLSPSGDVRYEKKLQALKRVAKEATVKILSKMMEQTTLTGTSRKEFNVRNRPTLPGIGVAAKTGTLKGDDPWGLTNWFIATAPTENPKIAIAVVVVDDGHMSTKASRIGRMVLQEYFGRTK